MCMSLIVKQECFDCFYNNHVALQLITMVQTIKDLAKGFFDGKLVDLVDEELVSN